VTRFTRRSLVLLAVAAMVLVTAAAPPSLAQAPIRIGASLSLTGTYAALGQNQQRGYQLCARQVNEKGGVLGRKVEFVFYDDQSQPATGVRLYERLITQDRVELVMGPYSSAISEAVANVNEKYKMPMIAPMASIP
jgi:branched-chain amino acid transport system substrate-binding protein